MQKIGVLFVCLGNICRSPMAQAVFAQLVEDSGLTQKFVIDSAGTAGYHIGDLPDERTRTVLAKHNIALNHFGRQLSYKDLEDFEYILVMDTANYVSLQNLLIDSRFLPKIHLLREFDPVAPGSVPDPYYGDLEDFESVYTIIERSCSNLLHEILKNKNLDLHN